MLVLTNRTAYIRHGPWCPDGTWAAMPFWLALEPSVRERLEELLGEGKNFDRNATKAANPEWCPNLCKAKEEGLPLFITANPGDYPPKDLLEGYVVLLVDFCYGKKAFDILMQEIGPTGHVIILDHHETNEQVVAAIRDEYSGRITTVFDTSRSGAEIAWEFARAQGIYTGPDSRVKDYVGDRDMWKFALAYSREINAALRVENISSSLGSATAAYHRETDYPTWLDTEAARSGECYLRAQAEIVQAIASGAKTAYVTARADSGELEEYKIRVVNSPTFQSEIGHELASRAWSDGGLPDFVAVWCYKHGYDEMHISVRTARPDINLSKIAPAIVGAINGGGHPAAAGCAVKGSDVKAIFRNHTSVVNSVGAAKD